jgi:hypothetical protein
MSDTPSLAHEPRSPRDNEAIADRLAEVAGLLSEQGANPFQARAYREAASTVRSLDRSVREIHRESGIEGLQALPGIGGSIARSIRDLLVLGRLPMLDRLREGCDPMALLTTIPGVGPRLAERFHHELDVDSLEDLEVAAHDGRLQSLPGIGPRRAQGIRDSLAQRLARVRASGTAPRAEDPSVAEILDVDAEYRAEATAGRLRLIAPRRFNPERRAWLPILHTTRDGRHYTALFSNTPRAHWLGKTHDWVVIYADGGDGERQWTVITSEREPFAGRRIVRGREAECLEVIRAARIPPP